MKRRNSADSVSSEDSLDIDPPPLPHGSSTPSPYAQYGIGATLMKKMGYNEGEGLGSSKQGILEPIEQKKRPKNTGLGSIPVIDLPLSQETIVNRKEQQINIELSELRRLQNYIQAQSPSELNIRHFYTEFSILPSWHDDRLWEVLEISGLQQLSNLQLSEFESVEVMEILEILFASLPSSRYAAVLSSVWFSRLQNPTIQDVSRLITSLLNQLRSSRLLASMKPRVIDLLASEPVYFHYILEDEQVLNSCAEALPEISTNLLDLALRNQLSEQHTYNLCSVLSPARTLQVFGSIIAQKHELLDGITTLETWQPLLSSKSLLFPALDKFILPLWYEELKTRLESNELGIEWWDLWRKRLVSYDQEEMVETWVLRGLNLVNEMYDLGVTRNERTPDTETINRIDLVDVLQNYCDRRGFQLRFLDVNKGVASTGVKALDWQIIDEVLYIKQKDEKIPVSIYDLDYYI